MLGDRLVFNVGDRVSRPRDLQGSTADDRIEFRYGAITEIYQGHADGLGRSATFYAITWDDTGRVERGYLGMDLHRVNGGGSP